MAKLAINCNHGSTDEVYLGTVVTDPPDEGVAVIKGKHIVPDDFSGKQKWTIHCPRCRRNTRVTGANLRAVIDLMPQGTRSLEMSTVDKILDHLSRGHVPTNGGTRRARE